MSENDDEGGSANDNAEGMAPTAPKCPGAERIKAIPYQEAIRETIPDAGPRAEIPSGMARRRVEGQR